MNRKTKIYVLVLVWGAIAVQLLINSNISRENVMVREVMASEQDNVMCSEVKAYAYYGDKPLSKEKCESIVKKMASKLGVYSGYDINYDGDGNRNVVTLKKQGEAGDTCVRVVSSQKEGESGEEEINNYITVEVNLKAGNYNMVYQLKRDIVKIYKVLGMEADTNIYICSQRKGSLSDIEKENETKNFLEELNAKEVERVDLGNTICIYGYSKDVNEYVYQGDEKVNVNIAYSYDEQEDVTYIHRAIPFIDKSF